MSNEKKISNAYIDNNDLVVRNRLPPYPIPDVSVAEYFYNIIQKQSESFVLVVGFDFLLLLFDFHNLQMFTLFSDRSGNRFENDLWRIFA